MLGLYENFPATIHKTAHFNTLSSNKKLQQRLTEALQKLNTETLSLETVTDPSIPKGTVNFEFGIAEANNFNYLDSEEAITLVKTINKSPLEIMDFFCVAQYHKPQKEKATRLRFDYYMLRFTFHEGSMDTVVFHERGPRYMSPEDIVNLIVNRVNQGSLKKMLKEAY
jgi:hypothetical protein